MFESMFSKSFNSGKCKTLLRLAISRIKLLRNKRDIQLKQMKREMVQLLQTNQEPSARIRVEHIFREQNIMAAYEIIELFCELVVVRLPIIDSQKQCPIDLKEAVASIIFAAPRCSDLPELLQVRNLFNAKYGKEFVAAAAELRPDCGVNRLVIEKLSIKPPSGEVKLKLMKDISAEMNFDWDPAASEAELLKAPEDLLEGPTRFLGATQMSLPIPPEEPIIKDPTPSTKEPTPQYNQNSGLRGSKTFNSQDFEATEDEKQFIPFVLPSVPTHAPNRSQSYQSSIPKQTRFENKDEDGENKDEPDREDSYKDVAAAARAAAICAERAAAAARAAALLASKSFDRNTDSDDDDDDDGGGGHGTEDASKWHRVSKYQHDTIQSEQPSNKGPIFDEPVDRTSSMKPDYDDGDNVHADENHIGNRELYSKKFATHNWRFDDEDEDDGTNRSSKPPKFDTEEDGIFARHSGSETYDSSSHNQGGEPAELSFEKTVPSSSHTLPDYDELIARFHSLRSTGSK